MHSPHLLETLSLAASRQGFCAPNPAVGAVVVRDGEILARGTHLGPGTPHAEAAALAGVTDEQLRGATLYVSLEPCCHVKKRTPPCTELLIARGVERVVFAHLDPNPEVSGRGASRLREVGIDCRHEPVEAIDRFYAPYVHWSCSRRPFVTAKLALTLDGKVAHADGRPYAITSGDALAATHLGRRGADAILTTSRTLSSDDPRLDCRMAEEAPIRKPVYVLDARAETPVAARVFDCASRVTIFVSDAAPPEKIAALEARGARIRVLATSGGWLDLPAALDAIGADGAHELWIEAGPTLFEKMRSEGLLQRALLHVAPKWLAARGTSAFREAAEDPFAGHRSLVWTGAGADAICEVRW